MYDWAVVPLPRLQVAEEAHLGHYLLLRRSQEDATDITYYVVFAPRAEASLEQPVKVAGQRWKADHQLEAGICLEQGFELAKVIHRVRTQAGFPVVLGGDCSILLACMMALKWEGTFGLAYLDGHADFYQPEAEPLGEAASMDLDLVVGRGPDLLTNLAQCRPNVQETHVVQIGRRDAHEADRAGSQRIEDSAVHCFDLTLIREQGMEAVLKEALRHLTAGELAGYWIHFDVDVLADEIMPAVDYRIAGGLSFNQASQLLRHLLQTGRERAYRLPFLILS